MRWVKKGADIVVMFKQPSFKPSHRTLANLLAEKGCRTTGELGSRE
jgi:hypothetical protein